MSKVSTHTYIHIIISMYCITHVCLYTVGIMLTSTLLIGYYHGLLLRDINADSLIGDLYTTGLLTAEEQHAILCGHSSHHRNWLLLEHVRHMNSHALLVFSELLNDVWPQIGKQLVIGVLVFICTCMRYTI